MPYTRKTEDLFISAELKKVLKVIKTESLVARMLLKKRQPKDILVDSFVNYISISEDDNSKISYMSQDRMKKIDKNEYWTSPRRYKAKPGSFISKIFKNIHPVEVEKFSSLFRTVSTKPKFTFKVVKGDDIKKYYSWRSYTNDNGSLGISCMKHDNCQKLFDIYTKSDKVSMLVMLSPEGLLMGRALLWETSPKKVMDRIYTVDDELLRFHFQKWATDNNYWYKSEQNWYNTIQFEQVGKKKIELELEVMLDKAFKYYPYMDTFKFIDTETNKVFNYIPESGNIMTLATCDGSKYDGDYFRFDSINRIFRHRGETVYIEYKQFYTHDHNTRWSRLNNQYILIEDAEYCEKIDDYIFKDHSKNKPIENEVNERETKKDKTENFINAFNRAYSQFIWPIDYSSIRSESTENLEENNTVDEAVEGDTDA